MFYLTFNIYNLTKAYLKYMKDKESVRKKMRMNRSIGDIRATFPNAAKIVPLMILRQKSSCDLFCR